MSALYTDGASIKSLEGKTESGPWLKTIKKDHLAMGNNIVNINQPR